MAEYRYLANPDPQWENYPHNLPPGTPICGMKRERKPIIPQEGLDIIEYPVKGRGGHDIGIRSYTPTGKSDLPLLMYMHGGGYVLGGLENDDSTCRRIAADLQVSVVNIEYRLAPEHKFPCGVEDCQDILRWSTTKDGTSRLKADLSKGFILGGTSAGANFTAVLSHEAVLENMQPPLTGLLFMAGSFCHPDVRPEKYRDRILSVDEINDAPGLTRKSIDYFAGKYGAPPGDVRLSPLLYGFHDRLAQKAYFQICGWDPRRDEAILYEQILAENKILTRKDVYPGKPHGWWTTCPTLESSKNWLEDLLVGVKWLLSTED
ncbi:Alpha/Beta hydrolase protein [Halenospora varia]|nr:Alpha/Beta hydrolase protein [Halenospora varia]